MWSKLQMPARSIFSFAIAHRGAPRLAPENTLAALFAAKSAGAAWVECDVMLTRDHEPVIFHDARLERMTDGAGYVSQCSLAKIQSLDCGGEKIPTLLEWLNLCRQLNINLNLEIKAHTQKQADLLVKCILRDLKQSRFPLSKLLISSFYLNGLLLMMKKKKNIRVGFNSHQKVPNKLISRLSKMRFFSVHQRYSLLNKKVVDHLHQHNLYALAYTVDDVKTAKKLQSIGVDAIFTNNEKMY